ncbi:MAG: TRAP transporter substrate-binding protein [Candidatus Adiutrix sp.]|jgi:tripartite ATP-independent transporter DctP family solute receptor|nr:TRAP transporter substrate-binding protein [Candidatus Adiutrix sp.]
MMKKTASLFIMIVCLSLGAGPALAQQKADPDKTYVIKATSVFNPSHVWIRGLEKFKTLLAEKSGGQLKVQVYPAGQLSGGNNRTMCEQIQAGTLEVILLSPFSWGGLVAEPQIFALPFMFPSTEVALKVAEYPEALAMLDRMYAKVGVKNLAVVDHGFRYLTNSKREVRKPEDAKGLKLRVPPTPLLMDEFQLMGALSVSIPMTELYTSLQQGTVDGQENPSAAIDSNKMYEVNKFITVWNFTWDPGILQINAKFYESLPEEYQKMVDEAAAEVGRWINETVASEDQMLLEKFAAAGGINSILIPEEIKTFEEFFQPIHDKYSKEYGLENYRLLKDLTARVLAGETYKP